MHWLSSGKVMVSIRDTAWDGDRVELDLACVPVCMLTFCWVMRFCESQSTATTGQKGWWETATTAADQGWWIYLLCWLADLLSEEVKLPRGNWKDFFFFFFFQRPVFVPTCPSHCLTPNTLIHLERSYGNHVGKCYGESSFPSSGHSYVMFVYSIKREE